jgi:hypothetical protein
MLRSRYDFTSSHDLRQHFYVALRIIVHLVLKHLHLSRNSGSYSAWKLRCHPNVSPCVGCNAIC